MGKELDELEKTLNEKTKNAIPVQTVWVEVSEVDWDDRTMTAVGVEDELEYYNILLGLESFDIKPKVGTTCLIGMIDNNATTPFLLMANEVEEIDIKVEGCQLNISNGFLLKKENETLKKLMLDLITAIRNMVFQTNSGITIELLTDLQFEAIENRFKTFLKDN